MQEILDIYKKDIDLSSVKTEIEKLKKDIPKLKTVENLKKLFNFIDLTTLNSTDSDSIGIKFCERVNNLQKSYPNMPDVAAICVYPTLVETIKKNLKKDNITIASVTAGFPSSQTFLAIKAVESRMAVAKGADEIDIVISVGKFLEKQYKEVYSEIAVIKEAVADIHVKVILETGALPSLNDVRTASIIAMEAGGDFIKTSTGKIDVSATPEAAYAMTDAIKDYHSTTKKKIGFKPAGGIATTDDALLYMSIVKNNLGEEWLNNKLFRIGASRLANNLIADIQELELGKKGDVKYF